MIDFKAWEDAKRDELFWEGVQARNEGLSINSNPYKDGTWCSDCWIDGWEGQDWRLT